MSNLAIRGHEIRGKEIIEILEMLGGSNPVIYDGSNDDWYYCIENDEITRVHWLDNFTVFTLEEFLEKFPYKVGDRVQYESATSYSTVYVIERMKWVNNHTEYEIRPLYDYNLTELVTLCAEDLQPNKEDIESVYAYNEINCYHQDFGDKVRIRLGNDFEIKIEDNVTYIVKKQPQYPKTYIECAKILDCFSAFHIDGYKNEPIEKLQELLICRDAYWKIVGEQMGLGRPWEPRWNDDYQKKWIINFYQGAINLTIASNVHFVLAFPEKEMRDAFYENFKELIEECKELL